MDRITKCFQDLSAGAGYQSLQGTGVESPHRVTSTSVGRFVSSFLCVEILGWSSELDFRDTRCCQNEGVLKATVVKLMKWAAKAMSCQPLVSIEQGYLHGLALAHFGDRRQHWRNRRPKPQNPKTPKTRKPQSNIP